MRENLQGGSSLFAGNQVLNTILFKIPVALAMWNQVGSECKLSRHWKSVFNAEADWHTSCPPHTHVCVFQQERIRPMVLGFSFIRSCCIPALCGYNPDALYVSFFLQLLLTLKECLRLVLPFVKPVRPNFY